MEEVAASSQEQSASTQEIAAAAGTLASAAEHLSRLVANLKLEGEQTSAAPDPLPRPASDRPIEPRAEVGASALLPEPALA